MTKEELMAKYQVAFDIAVRYGFCGDCQWIFESERCKQCDCYVRSVNVIKDAIYKQIPQQPISSKDWCISNMRSIYDSDPFQWYCPNCNSIIGVDGQASFTDHCCDCGQALDWSDIE